MCYTERDSLEVMLTKTGTITQNAANVHSPPGAKPGPEEPTKGRRGSKTAEEMAREPHRTAVLTRQDAKGGGGKKKKKHDNEMTPRQTAQVELV